MAAFFVGGGVYSPRPKPVDALFYRRFKRIIPLAFSTTRLAQYYLDALSAILFRRLAAIPMIVLCCYFVKRRIGAYDILSAFSCIRACRFRCVCCFMGSCYYHLLERKIGGINMGKIIIATSGLLIVIFSLAFQLINLRAHQKQKYEFLVWIVLALAVMIFCLTIWPIN